MQKLDTLRQNVETLYTAGHPEADVWIDWSYPNHVLFVAEHTEKIAATHHANIELAVAGALLHDIADAVMARRNPEHEAKSLALADGLLRKSGFNEDETTFVVNEVIKPHSCKQLIPTALEGKVMATADGAAHFLTDFYPLFCWRHYGPQDDYEVFKHWMLGKMEKDFTKKLFFNDVKQQVLPRYEALKLIFS
ncbi:MAG TPA: HD domain-containing protein [Nevskiaceae bacterium]|nr:HD domain-containing protein [Nevskiaceae bacterium]